MIPFHMTLNLRFLPSHKKYVPRYGKFVELLIAKSSGLVVLANVLVSQVKILV